jgi:membrane associated rhomboid family serine protease
MHAGLLHLGANMLFLFVFGPDIEYLCGHLRYLVFYLLCGVIGNVAQVWIVPSSHVPAVGASGAIAGVLGAYLVSFPRSRVVTFVPLLFIPWIVEIPAIAYLVIWFAMQLVSGLASLHLPGMDGGVAWWAHVGGFVAGIVGVLVLAPASPRSRPRALPM